MNENVLSILRDTYKEYGDSLFTDNLRLKSYLADLLVDYPVERKRLLLAVNENIVKKLVSEKSSLSRCSLYEDVLVDTYALPVDVSHYIVESFYYAINGKFNEQNFDLENEIVVESGNHNEVDNTFSLLDLNVDNKKIPVSQDEDPECDSASKGSLHSKHLKVIAWCLLAFLVIMVFAIPIMQKSGVAHDAIDYGYIAQANVNIYGLDVGNSPSDLQFVSDNSNMYIAILDYCYYYDDTINEFVDMESYSKFVDGEEYFVRFKFSAENGYQFDNFTTYMANSEITNCYGSEDGIELYREIKLCPSSFASAETYVEENTEILDFNFSQGEESVVLDNYELPPDVFEQSIKNCKEFSLTLEIIDVMTGYPYAGKWKVYLRNIAGDWNEVHCFEYEENSEVITTIVSSPGNDPFEEFDAFALVIDSDDNASFSYWYDVFDFVIIN